MKKLVRTPAQCYSDVINCSTSARKCLHLELGTEKLKWSRTGYEYAVEVLMTRFTLIRFDSFKFIQSLEDYPESLEGIRLLQFLNLGDTSWPCTNSSTMPQQSSGYHNQVPRGRHMTITTAYIYTLRSACSLVKIHRECKARCTVDDICSTWLFLLGDTSWIILQ